MAQKRILLLDASPDMAESMSLMFDISGIETVVASSLQKTRVDEIDAVIVEIDSLTELPAVKRNIDRLPAGTPVIAISGHSNDRFRDELMRAGFSHFLVKGEPVDWLVDVLRGSRCRSDLRAAELAAQLKSMDDVSEMLEAIEKKNKSTWRGHCLNSWRYEMVPWGVRFLHLASNRTPDEAIVSLVLPNVLRHSLGARYQDDCIPTIVLMLNPEQFGNSLRC